MTDKTLHQESNLPTKESNGMQNCPKCHRLGDRLSESTDFVLMCHTPTCPVHQWFPHKLKSGYYKTPITLGNERKHD